jgi:hypothetical protein
MKRIITESHVAEGDVRLGPVRINELSDLLDEEPAVSGTVELDGTTIHYTRGIGTAVELCGPDGDPLVIIQRDDLEDEYYFLDVEEDTVITVLASQDLEVIIGLRLGALHDEAVTAAEEAYLAAYRSAYPVGEAA